MLITLITVIYADVDASIAKMYTGDFTTSVNKNFAIFKVTKYKCLKHLNANYYVYGKAPTLYELQLRTDDNKSKKMLLIKRVSTDDDKYKLYYRATYFKSDNLDKKKYPFTLVMRDGGKGKYIETIQFLDKIHAIKRAGYANGLVEEVYLERIGADEVKKYQRFFPSSTKPSKHKGAITEWYFNHISQNRKSTSKKIFTYSPKKLSKKELHKLYGLFPR